VNPVALFTWLSRTPVYRDIHVAAVHLLPRAARGESWLDLGCGPGLVTQTAADRGYSAIGIDTSAGMISAARRIAHTHGSSAQFELGSASTERPAAFDVVSAASLLFVVPDRVATAQAMWRAVRPGGSLLIIETTASMTPAAARALDRSGWSSDDRRAITLWAAARQGRAVDPRVLLPRAELPGGPDWAFHPLLGGLVGAWVAKRL
jgi:ubiquinone/menaquinone biosynthesis C-methylase UbiE